ncbi:hypothetical protein ACOMHN_056220 [Nucella lapillus]
MSDMSRKKLCVLCSGGVILLATGGIMIPVVDMLYRDSIRDTAIITNGSEFWEAWVAPPVPIYMQFYMFNVTNPEAVKKGEKPILTEQGPYSYREERKKENIVFNENGTVTYRERHTYFFQRNMSAGNETDLITTGNLPVLVAANFLQYAPSAYLGIVSLALATAKQDLFVTRSVRDLLWGYTDPDLQQLKQRRPNLIPSAFVGYFIHRNNTDNGQMTVFTGKNGRLSFWSTGWANMINGTDGSLFPPFQQGMDSVNVFALEICRSTKAVFQKSVETKQGIPLRRYVASEGTLQNSSANPDNLGFCTPQTKCLPTDLLNITNCVKGRDNISVPAVASFPHFYLADPMVQQSVEGLNPDPHSHENVVNVEPWTGLVLRAYKRLQINMHMMKLDGFRQTYNVRSLYFPIFWIAETMEVGHAKETKLQKTFFGPMQMSSVLEKVFLITGAPVILLVMFLTCRQRQKRNRALMASLPPGPVPNTTLSGSGSRGAGARPKRQRESQPAKETGETLFGFMFD